MKFKEVIIKTSKNAIYEQEVKNIFEISPPLQEEYQNKGAISNTIMESKRYHDYGCRAIAIFRMTNHVLKQKKIIRNFVSMVTFDKIADEGGLINDCWVDDQENPVYNVLSAYRFIDRINKKYNSDLKYKLIMKKDCEKEKKFLIDKLNNNIPLSVRMKNLSHEGYSHFVNITGYAQSKNDYYFFKMKETFYRYDGYDEKYIPFAYPNYYEIIY